MQVAKLLPKAREAYGERLGLSAIAMQKIAHFKGFGKVDERHTI